MLVSWSLDISNASTVISAAEPDIFTSFGSTLFFTNGPSNGDIEFVSGTAAVPLPAAGLLYLPVLLAGAYSARRKMRAA